MAIGMDGLTTMGFSTMNKAGCETLVADHLHTRCEDRMNIEHRKPGESTETEAGCYAGSQWMCFRYFTFAARTKGGNV